MTGTWDSKLEADTGQNHVCACTVCTDLCGPGIYTGYRCRDCAEADAQGRDECHPR